MRMMVRYPKERYCQTDSFDLVFSFMMFFRKIFESIVAQTRRDVKQERHIDDRNRKNKFEK